MLHFFSLFLTSCWLIAYLLLFLAILAALIPDFSYMTSARLLFLMAKVRSIISIILNYFVGNSLLDWCFFLLLLSAGLGYYYLARVCFSEPNHVCIVECSLVTLPPAMLLYICFCQFNEFECFDRWYTRHCARKCNSTHMDSYQDLKNKTMVKDEHD